MQRSNEQEHAARSVRTSRLIVRALLSLVAAAAVAAAVAGCQVNEKKEVAKYRSVIDASTRSVEFTAGDPLPLEAALLLANANNERIGISGEDYLQSLIDKDRATASFLPTVSLIPSYSFAQNSSDRRNSQSGNDIGDPGNPDDNLGGGSTGSRSTSTGTNNFDLPVNLRMNLFNGFRDVANVRRAGSEIQRRRWQLLDLQEIVLLDVAQTYYQVLRSEQSVRVLENSVQVQDERVRDMRARNRVGVARPLDVAQTEAQAASTRASLVLARTNARNGRTVLSFLIDQDVSRSPLSDDVALPAELPAVDTSLAGAEQGRQDLAAARAAVDVAKQDLQLAVGQYYPSVNLNFNYYLERHSNPEDSLYNGLISANLPIFTGGVIHANVRAALSRLRQAKLDESLTRRTVEQDVRLAHSNLQASANRLKELQIGRDAAREALRQAEGNYAAGRATNLERLVAQDQVLSAELELATATYDQKLFYLNLQRVTGSISDALSQPPETGPTTQPLAVCK
jgi:outer membrane protein